MHAMKRFGVLAPIFMLAGTMVASAQAPPVSVYFGLGTATDSSSGQQINTFGDGNLYNTPKITGLFGNLGGNVMITPHYGFGGEFSWRTSQGDYAGLKYRPLLYDFNGIWQPLGNKKRVVPEFQGGIGAVDLRYYLSSTACDQFVGCQTSNGLLESANHFQTHFSGAARVYLTQHLFLRPAVDVHYVNNFNQFGSNWMPQYTLGVGYSFGNAE
jgi:hypothetical protein